MVQTTHGLPAAKAEVVSIILWFWVRIPVGPPLRARLFSLWSWTQGFGGLANLYAKLSEARLYVVPRPRKVASLFNGVLAAYVA
ncbi:hypothetical protein Oter_1035 [Opitutus terrae PB90-1]|uniref:Uncharacterized protein n=1 Tax=Opitutus terrae (strain DSM 11246 / JCM 15787 / PB90-1) TaxID=452637 RepID=B1ZMH8_OPITP|nr:hypothetical protein Oter_1035 [Opitutus terrae PB90-1]